MGQFYPSKEKIGSLSESGGTITLADSHIKIGGQGYDTGELELSVGTATANTLYMIYAVRSAGNTILVKSVNYNSIGPTSYDSWKLAGAFYSAAADTFGSFVNIEDTPICDWTPISNALTLITTTTDVNLNLVGTIYRAAFKRIGDTIEVFVNYRQNSASTQGSGDFYVFKIFGGLSLDTTKAYAGGGNAIQGDSWGYGRVWDTTTVKDMFGLIYNSTSWRWGLSGSINGWAPIDTVNFGDTQVRLAFRLSAPITEWSSTPLKDL